MACSKTKRLAGRNWPLHRITNSGLCCYKVTVNSAGEAAIVVADAHTKPDYVKCSPFYGSSNNTIWFYLYFRQS